MDRLKRAIEAAKSVESYLGENEGGELFDEATFIRETLESQSLSQEAVRDEALEAACKLRCDFCKEGYLLTPKGRHHQVGDYQLPCKATDIRALKREPNAAEDSGDWPNFSSEAERYAPDYDDGDPARWPPSGPVPPAAPAVMEMVKRLRERARELAGSTLITAQDDSSMMFKAASLLDPTAC